MDQLWRQEGDALAVLVFSFVLTWIMGTVIQQTIGVRISEDDEVAGIDTVVHVESGYDFASLGSSGSTAPPASQARAGSPGGAAPEGMARNTERTMA